MLWEQTYDSRFSVTAIRVWAMWLYGELSCKILETSFSEVIITFSKIENQKLWHFAK